MVYRFFRCFKKSKEIITKCYYSNALSLSEIKKEFSKYPGGEVNLSQDNETGIAYICLNNPDKRNALTGKMMVQLSEIVTHLEEWKNGKALILYSNGDTFCSGADLTTVRNINNSEGGMHMSYFMHDTLYRLSMLPLVSVALIQGKALGGGAELTLACDFRLLTTNAIMQFVQIKMGTITGMGGGTRLVNLIGYTTALKLLLSCQKLNAEEALKLQLADSILDESEDLLEQGKCWLTPYLHGSTEVIQTMKKSIAYAAWINTEKSFDKERTLFSTVWGGPANLEALKKNEEEIIVIAGCILINSNTLFG